MIPEIRAASVPKFSKVAFGGWQYIKCVAMQPYNIVENNTALWVLWCRVKWDWATFTWQKQNMTFSQKHEETPVVEDNQTEREVWDKEDEMKRDK